MNDQQKAISLATDFLFKLLECMEEQDGLKESLSYPF